MAPLPYGIDHYILTNYFKQPAFNVRKPRCINFLSGFDFKIKHLKGKGNRVADSLSQKVHCIYEISYNEVLTTFHELIRKAAKWDPEYQSLWQQAKVMNNRKQ